MKLLEFLLLIGIVLSSIYLAYTIGYHQACKAAAYDITHTNDGISYSTDLIEPSCGAYLK